MDNKNILNELTKVTYEKVITLLSVFAVLLIVYRLFIFKEDFIQVDVCDYNSPNPDEFCQSIQKGCTDLKYENKNLTTTLKDNCTNLPTDTKDVINKAIVCNDTSNKIIMNNYVQSEVCSQIKNLPEILPETQELTPSTNILLENSVIYKDKAPSETYKPLDNLTNLSVDVYGKPNNTFFLNTDNVNYAPF
jgi:hypothetical protein